MLKKYSKKKSLIVASAVTAPLAVALGATFFTIHSNEAVSNSNVYENLIEGENLFKIYSPYFNVTAEEKNDILSSYLQAKNQWASKDKNLQEKLDILDKAQDKAFNFYINNLDKFNLEDQKPTIFWKKILSNQEGRIRELDLKDQLTQLKEDQSLKFFDVLYSATNEQKQEYLHTLATEISKLVVNQNKILEPFINLLQGTSSKIDSILFEGLKKDVSSSLVPLYSRIISSDIRLNEVEIASQDTNKKVASLEEMLNKSQNQVNEINEYLNLIKPYTENAIYTDAQKANVKKFLDATKINLNIAQSQADINAIRNNLVTFYQQISDSNKSVSEIKEVIRGLSDYVNKFDPQLDFNKKLVNDLIDKTLLTSDKNTLISQKADLFSEFYSLKFANELLLELKEKVKVAVADDLISESKGIIINSQSDVILSKKLPNKQLANDFFAFYNVQSKELDQLKYLNNELKLIETQSTFVKNLPFANKDILNKLDELHNQVIKTYSNEVTSTFLAGVNNKLNEEFRLILKAFLKQLINQANDELALLKNLDNPINNDVIEEAKKLEAVALPLTVDFAPVPTSILIENIKSYNLKIQNLINANKQSQTEEISDFADDYLTAVFSDGKPDYIPTKNEQQRIDLYNKLKKRLDELRKLVNDGNGSPEIQKELEEIQAQLQNLTDTAGKFRDLSNLDKQILETIKRKLDGENATGLKPYVDAIEKIRKQLDGLFADPNATKEQIDDLINQLNKALKDLNEADTKILLEKKIANLKETISAKFDPNTATAGSNALNKHLKDLIEEAKDVSNPEKSNKAIDLANKLIAIAPVLFDLEVNKKRLQEIIGQKASAKYNKTRTTEAINNGNAQITNADDLVARLNNPDNIPNLEAFESEKTNLFLRGNEILLAYEQDKIEEINKEIQATVTTQTTEANTRYKASLERINNYAVVKKSELIFDKAQEAATKMEKLLALAIVSKELLDFYNQYNSGQTTSLAGYINNLLLNNELLSSDSDDVIIQKTTTLTNAKEIIDAKKEFLDAYNSLASILSDGQNWKIYAQLMSEITLISEETNAIIFDNDLTVEQIRDKKVELAAKIESFKRQKEALLKAFNDAVKATDAQLTQLENDVTKAKQNNPDYSFDTYYNTTKEAYNKAKQDDQKPNIDTADINNFALKLQVAYQKDLALNKLKDLENFATSGNYGDSDLHQKAKTARNTFDALLKIELAKETLTLAEVQNIIEKIQDFAELFNLEKHAIDYVNSLQPRTDVQHLSIKNLQDTINNTYPSSDNNYNDLKTKYSQLREVLFKEFDIDKFRELINFIIDNQDSAKGIIGVIKSFTDTAGANYDTSAKTKLDAWADSIKSQTKNASTKEELTTIFDKVTKIKGELNSIVALAQATKVAETTLANLINNDSPLINSYSSNLTGFITEAKNNYFKESTDDNKGFYNTLKDKISFTKDKILQADLLASKLKEIRTIVASSDFNLRSINDQSGLDKLAQLNSYLNSFETTAMNNDFSNEAVQKIITLKEKAEKFKNIIDIDNTVLTTVNNWSANPSATKTTDVKSLLQLVWDSIPTSTTNTNTTLGKQAGNTYNVNDLFDLSSANTKSIAEYTQLSEKIVTEITASHQRIQTRNTYREATDNKIKALQAKPFTALVHNALKDALLTFLATLETQNNAQTSFSITPDETGELNQTRAKVEIVENNFDALKTLAEKVYQLNNLNNQIISTDATVTTAKNQAQSLITKAHGYYNDTTKMSATGNESIASLTAQVEEQFFRLNLLSKYQIVQNLYQNDKTLDDTEKAPIKAKLDSFSTEYNTPNAVPRDLYNKYFREASELGQNEPATAKNTLIKYALENAINLKKAYNDAKAFLGLEDDSLDDADVKSKIALLKATTTDMQNGPEPVIKAMDNDETVKVNLLNNITDEITNLVTAKKDQLNRQLTLDNEVKAYVDNNAATFNKMNVANPYVTNFLTHAITDITNGIANLADLTYSQVNILLKNAKSVLNDQIFDLYNKGKHEVQNIQNKIINYFNDFDATHVDARNGAGVTANDYSPIANLNTLVNTALGNDLSSVENYTTKINSMIAVISQNVDNIINTFTTHIKDTFKHKFNPKSTQANAGLPGFYVKLFEVLDPLKQTIAGKQQGENNYKYNNIQNLEVMYNVLKSEFESINSFYASILDKTDSTSLSLFATKVDDLNNKFVDFQNAVRQEVRAAVDNNPLVDIFADLYTVSYNDDIPETRDIRDQYSRFKATLNQKVVAVAQLNKDVNTFNNLNENSSNATDMFEILSSLYTNKDWLNDSNRKMMLFNPLNVNPNRANLLEATASDDLRRQSQFNQKYKVIIAKDDVIREKFESNFNEIVALNNASNPADPNLVRIDNNDNFLDMFQQFAFTKKDIQVQNDVKSIFSPVTFKVYIEKYDVNGWFQDIGYTTDVDRKSLKARLVYVYDSNATNLGKVTVKKEDVIMTFRTLDIAEIPSGNNTVFYDPKDISTPKVGIAAKVEALDVDKAGWSIRQISSNSDPNYNNTRQEVIRRIYNKMKEAIFGFNNTNSENNMSNGVLVEKFNEYQNTLQNPQNNVGLDNVSLVGSAASHRISAYLDKNNRDRKSMYGFDFHNQENVAITFNTQLTTTKDSEYLRIFPLDNEKGFAFLQIQGGYLTGFVTRGSSSGSSFSPEVYDGRIRDSNFDIYRGNGGNLDKWWEIDKNQTPTGVNLNLYKFNIDYDPVKRKVYFYNSWVENTLFLPNRGEIGAKILDFYATASSNLKQDDASFIQNIGNNFQNNQLSPNYIASPEDLARVYSIASSNPDTIFMDNAGDSSSKLPIQAVNAFGSSPFFPINGGQAVIVRNIIQGQTGAPPEAAMLNPIDPNGNNLKTLFTQNRGSDWIIKESARAQLYSASINKFWFKIRNR
ncbi:hypothetical protein NPA08_03680 [Mycoplasmopsis citelli]|uniref:hypothetical protein n=1 Tax=Mycoplasmopsis citelli TaxID=171281 RepID=UPI002114A9B2|nr:hypothetical protein [Mycoplasmopsis citelli]UUD36027.1 hypothetical protein NPA08_03680 [Mycoplasmopsis citelli]